MTHIKGERFGLPLVARAGVLRQLGTFPVEWSRHDGPEVHYVFKGQTAWEVSDSTEPLRLSGGTFAVIPPGIRHRALDDQGAPAVRAGFLLVKHLVDMLQGSSFTSDDAAELTRVLTSHGMMPRKMPPRLLGIARDFADCLSLDNLATEGKRRHLRILTTALIDETVLTLETEPPLTEKEHVIDEICRWMDAHSMEAIDTEKLVVLSGYGRSRFFALFLQETDMTPRDYLIRCRIERAKRTIAQSPGKKLLTVAAECGFPSPSVFATLFRRHTGFSPREYAAKSQ